MPPGWPDQVSRSGPTGARPAFPCRLADCMCIAMMQYYVTVLGITGHFMQNKVIYDCVPECIPASALHYGVKRYSVAC